MRKLLASSLLALCAAGPALARKPAPTPGPEYERLEFLVGKWKGGGELKATPVSAAGSFTAKIDCSRFPGGRNVVCRLDGTIATAPYHELAIFGYDPDAKQYTWYDIDSQGVGSLARGSIEGETWIFAFEMKADGKPVKVRATITQRGTTRFTNDTEVSVNGGPWLLMQAVTMDKMK